MSNVITTRKPLVVRTRTPARPVSGPALIRTFSPTDQIAVGRELLEVQSGSESFNFKVRERRGFNSGSDKCKHAGDFQHAYFLAQADLYEQIAGE